MDRVVDVAEVLNVVLDAGDRLGVCEETLHFALRPAVSEFEIVEQRVLPAGKALVGRLDTLEGRAHFGRVVGHVQNRGVRRVHGCRRIAAVGSFQRSAEADGLLGVAVCGNASCSRLHGKFLCLVGGLAVERFKTAEALLQLPAGLEGVLEDAADRCDGQVLPHGAEEAAARLRARRVAGGLRGASQELGHFVFDPRRLRDDIYISVAESLSHCFRLPSWTLATH